MRASGSSRRAALAAVLGICTGAIVGGALLFASPAAEGDANDRPSLDPARLIDAAHVPALLTVPGEPVELRYDIYCPPPDGHEGAPCDASGSVFVRRGAAGPFRELPLVLDEGAPEGRYVARVPAALAADPSGFDYYAVVRNRQTGAALTVPGGGAAAPQRSLPIRGARVVDLGVHAFGRTIAATERVFAAGWGDGANQVGLEGGPETQPIGPSAFDVSDGGTLTVLDQVNRRALIVDRRRTRSEAVPLGINGTIADLAVARDGTAWVLETAGPGSPLLRAFSSGGQQTRVVPLAERTASQVRLVPSGPVVKQYPSEEWLPATAAATTLGRAAQRAAGEPAQPLEDGRRVSVLLVRNELRAALIGASGVERTWRVRSTTPLGEVQLAEPLGESLVVVQRVYKEGRDEFVVLVLGEAGIRSRFTVASADWAETAPLSRFRLAGGSLYRLGSDRRGAHVDRFDLEVTWCHAQLDRRPSGSWPSSALSPPRSWPPGSLSATTRTSWAPTATPTRRSTRPTSPVTARSTWLYGLAGRATSGEAGAGTTTTSTMRPATRPKTPTREARAETARDSRSRSGANRKTPRTRPPGSGTCCASCTVRTRPTATRWAAARPTSRTRRAG
ncbi:MAG: hypothetical protein ABR583_05535 [Gaiellaceae bacterium]